MYLFSWFCYHLFVFWLCKSSYDPTRVSYSQTVGRNIFCYDTVSSDDTQVSDCNSRTYIHAIARPTILANENWQAFISVCIIFMTQVDTKERFEKIPITWLTKPCDRDVSISQNASWRDPSRVCPVFLSVSRVYHTLFYPYTVRYPLWPCHDRQ